MDESLRRACRCAGLAACCLALAASTADAETGLPDPTRPPAALIAADGEAVTPAQPVLQSVMISPKRSVAIISGQAVALGQVYGDARVVGISESEVVLRSGREVQTLRLFPDLEKRPAAGGVMGKPARPQSIQQ